MGWIRNVYFCGVSVALVLVACGAQTRTITVRPEPLFSVEGLAVGKPVTPASAAYKAYDCKPSEQYARATWCHDVRSKLGVRISRTILHSSDGIVSYINKELAPAFLKASDIETEIARLSNQFGGSPRIYRLPDRPGFPKAIIATWGGVELQPLTNNDLAMLAQGKNPSAGVMVDFLGNFSMSARAGFPVYRLGGSKGFVWVASFDEKGKGELRFFAADPSKMTRKIEESRAAPQAPPPPSNRPDAPIIIGGDEGLEACGDTGEIVGLDPQGDGFLSVRSGSGDQLFQEKDRLFNGNEVYICAKSGPWLAVIYNDKRDLEQSCGVDKPWRTRQPYTGPCRYGWIHSTYVRIAEAKQDKSDAENAPQSPDSQPPVPGPPEPKERPSPKVNPPAARRDDDINEADFISVISVARDEYNSGSNEMVKGAARAHRRERLCQLVQGMDVRGWTGRITKLSSSSSGKGVLGVSIGPHITITTINNDFSDSFDHTLLDPSSNVFRQVVPLSVDQQILFSGSFLPSDTDCVREISLTQEGSMTDPEFLFHFTDVKAVQ